MFTPTEERILGIMIQANRRITRGEISQRTGLSWATIDNVLKVLEAKGAVSFKWIDNAKYWRVHEDRVVELSRAPDRSRKPKGRNKGD